ncbi:putative SERF-like protein [Musca domestica]|uniref:SERF-like protein n=1 Tax=Musca domestica TaxID=7370 RepID=A0A1I8MBU4_MUSDO|nr:putative SERF-like protein [Musca domestica]
MTRGNQRELARAKNQKKQQEINKGKRTDNLTVEQRKQRDAELMREKQRKKEEAARAASGQQIAAK